MVPSIANWGGFSGSSVHPMDVAVPFVATLATGMPGLGVGDGVSRDGEYVGLYIETEFCKKMVTYQRYMHEFFQ